VQVKYEMLRRVHAEDQSVRAASAAFGFSRPSFYHAQSGLARDGLPGLVPKKRGPHGGHKLTADGVAFVRERRAGDESLRASGLVRLIRERSALRVRSACPAIVGLASARCKAGVRRAGSRRA